MRLCGRIEVWPWQLMGRGNPKLLADEGGTKLCGDSAQLQVLTQTRLSHSQCYRVRRREGSHSKFQLFGVASPITAGLYGPTDRGAELGE